MNKVIIAQINGLTNKYEKALGAFKDKDNPFALFEFEYINYYKPFSLYILPEMGRHFLKHPDDHFSNYEHKIHPKYIKALYEELTENKKLPSDFLKKLSNDITSDFNKLWIAYRKMNEQLRENFIQQFIKNRKKAISILAEHHPELAIKTISKLCCPKLQFFLLNKLDPEVTKNIQNFLETYCWERVMKVLTEYCFYPHGLEPKDYFNQWEGQPYLHIKFCRIIMGNRYELAKEFLKMKAQYQEK